MQLAGEQIELQYNIDKNTLFQLVNERLLRTEERDNFRVYELSHDTLVEPILESRKIRIDEEQLKIEKEKEKEELKMKN